MIASPARSCAPGMANRCHHAPAKSIAAWGRSRTRQALEAAHPARVSDLSIPESHDPHRREGRWGSGTGYLVSFALVALVTLIGGVLFARGNSTDIGLLYLIPVMYAGTRHGLATGVVVGLASSLAYNFFFIPPTHTLSVDNPEHFITLLILLGWRWSAASLPRKCGSRRCWRKRGPIATPRWPVSRAGSPG
jgi:K+-sensing histidine kinase KdpD